MLIFADSEFDQHFKEQLLDSLHGEVHLRTKKASVRGLLISTHVNTLAVQHKYIPFIKISKFSWHSCSNKTFHIHYETNSS